MKYIGQTKININTMYKEHLAHARYNRPEKSGIAAHSIQYKHSFNINNFKILKEIVKPQYLNAWETFYINKSDKKVLLDNEDGPILNSKLIDLISRSN